VVEKKAPEKRLAKERRRVIRARIVVILAAGDPTPFAFEAACRHGLRAALCLAGWTWAKADREAADIVALALRDLGAQRPTWQQGQPDYAQTGTIILRERCLSCGASLLNELNTTYCSWLCRNRWHATMAATWRMQDGDAYRRAVRQVRGLDENHNA
jgi:hypothetical protein